MSNVVCKVSFVMTWHQMYTVIQKAAALRTLFGQSAVADMTGVVGSKGVSSPAEGSSSDAVKRNE